MASDSEPMDTDKAPEAAPEKKSRPKRVLTSEQRERLAKARAMAIAARKEKAAARREEKELQEKVKEGERHKLRQAAAEAEKLVHGSTSKSPKAADSPQPSPQPTKRAREPVRRDEEEPPQQRHAPRNADVEWEDYSARQRARDMYKEALRRQRGALITRTLYGF